MRYEISRRHPEAEKTFGVVHLVEKVDHDGHRWLVGTFSNEADAQRCLMALRLSDEHRHDDRR